MSDTKRIPYIVKDGVLRLRGALKYNDRELRLACMMLIQGPHPVVTLDLTGVPSLCSPEIQFIAKMADSAKQRGKFMKVQLSSTARAIFRELELDGLVQVEEVEATPIAAPRNPSVKT
jgi:anti-anti-sigma regulatory factor